MFIVASFTIAKTWEQPVSINRWMNNTHTHTHTHGRLFSSKKKEITQFVTTWMDLEGIMLSEMSQTEKGKFPLNSIIFGIQKCWTHREYKTHKNRVEWWLPGAGSWGKWRDVGQSVRTSSYKTNSGDLICSIMTIVNNTVLYTWKLC